MLTPLRFKPILKHYLWGGRKLATVLGKPLAPNETAAESWEVCDLRGAGQGEPSVVAAGPLAGTTLRQLVETRADELLGRHAGLQQFPLLFKFLDAAQPLSVQVHPDDRRAREIDPQQHGKTEAWVVLEAEPGATIYAGLKRGFDRPAVARELARGTGELCLHCFTPRAGDCIFLPAGAIHALGGGLLVAEVQQPSDTTYRLFDWNRLGPDGRPRPLHIEEGLAAIDYSLGPLEPVVPRATDRTYVERLVDCEQFVLDRWRIDAVQHAGGDRSAHILAVIEGELLVEGDPSGVPLGKGDTIVLPAALGPIAVAPHDNAVLLDAYLR